MRYSEHDIRLLNLPAQFWKWRMQGGAVTLARKFQVLDYKPDVIFASDMMDVSLFRAIVQPDQPIALYFHENQLTYPQNQRQSHGWRYGFINYASALAADKIYFNSQFHHDDFFAELRRMLKHFGDYNELDSIERLKDKAMVLPLGLELHRLDAHRPVDNADEKKKPLILWNHRWAAEKNPRAFFEALYAIAEDGYDFEVAIAGANRRQSPGEFLDAAERLGDRVIHFGFADSLATYALLLWRADYVVSPSYQDFFGISVAEAMYCECIPLLANRLNYPYLVPAAYHSACLFRDGVLPGLLEQHLAGHLQVDVAEMRSHIARYDWTHMAPQYDRELASLSR